MSEDTPCCYFHPREIVVGVCALCLKERLLVLASKQQGRLSKPTCTQHRRSFSSLTSTKSKLISITIPRVFSLGSTLLPWRSDLRPFRKNSPNLPPEDYTSSLEDSFISIKFGDDGKASWDEKKNQKELFYPCDGGKLAQNGSRSAVVEHAKRSGTLRWRRRVSHLLEVMTRWRSSSKNGSGQRKGWMRSLITRRRSRSRSRSRSSRRRRTA